MRPSLDQLVRGDRIRLAQVLGNLLDNALKFTAHGSVTLEAVALDAGDHLYRFQVRDTGIGFDQAIAETLFAPFQQADGSNTRQFSGAGLGLSISRELARAMGGELTAEGVPGRGAAFTLTLNLTPCAKETLPPQSTRPSAEASGIVAFHASPSPIRILLADDHETNRTVVRLILGTLGVDLVCAENGAEAVDAFASGPFDLVLMDLQMPVMDGVTAIRWIRAHEAKLGLVPTPILVLSANALPEHVQAARAAGADGHVAKPVTPPILIAAIENVLEPVDRATTKRDVA
jgi:CheY-like chemotaxis protein